MGAHDPPHQRPRRREAAVVTARGPDPGPPTLVIFGATGNLASGKIVPALFNLHRKKRLPPGTRILGASRQELTDAGFRDQMEAALRAHGGAFDAAAWKEFAPFLRYASGDVSTGAGLAPVRRALEDAGGGGRLYYLALAPVLYPQAIAGLQEGGLGGRGDGGAAGWRRLVIEKPFGNDLASARELNRRVLAVFDESQVFRIDHYLAKETVQNILVLRFANSIFEPLWNRNYIDHVQITVAESGVVGARGPYYDGAGVLRDMFQNHLLQLLALVAMEAPTRFDADTVRGEKVKLFDAVRRCGPADVPRQLVCGQYQGYAGEKGVRKGTRTPTFAAMKLLVDSWRWQGVPFYLRSGKGLAKRASEVVVQFFSPPLNMFDLPQGPFLEANRVILGIQPDEGVMIRFQTKVPDRGMEVRSSTLKFRFGDDGDGPVPDAYERLLLDALTGDATLFMRHDEIEQAWSIIDPLTRAQESGEFPSPGSYSVGSWGPDAADEFIARDGRAWIFETPQPDR